MKLKIIILLFPIFLIGQKNNENLSEINIIESQVKFADSISNSVQEVIKNSVVVPSHGRIDGEPTESTEIHTRILKFSNQILRISYKQSNSKEFWKYYYYDSKLIYVELNIMRSKKSKITKKKFYFENEKLISPSYSDKNYNVKEEVKIFIEGYDLLKSNS